MEDEAGLAPDCQEGCWAGRDQEALALGPGFFCVFGDVDVAVGNFGPEEDLGRLDFRFPKSANGSAGVALLCGTEPFVFREGVGEGTLFGWRGVAAEVLPQSPNKSPSPFVWVCVVPLEPWEVPIPKKSPLAAVDFAPKGSKDPKFVPLVLEPKG